MQKTWVAKRVLVEWMDISVLTNTEDRVKACSGLYCRLG